MGEILITAGVITRDDLTAAIEQQKSTGEKIGEILVAMGACTDAAIAEALSQSTGFELQPLNEIGVDINAANLITPETAKKYQLLPVSISGNVLNVVMMNPNDIVAKDDLKFMTGYDIRPVVASDSEIRAAINNFANFSTELEVQDEEEPDMSLDLGGDEGGDGDDAHPAIALANQILHSAVRVGASDIHIEPAEKILRVRYRIDGVLHETLVRPMRMHASLVSRVKVLGGMDIAERRIPQDGRATIKVDTKTVDIRIASLPSVYGEKLTLRMLVRSDTVVTMDQLGFAPHYQKRMDEVLKTPYGFVLVTGPTGSGKSTTLYASLAEVNTPDKNIITLEDPVERRMDGITQVQMNNRAGMTFASGLRSILRSDPDIVMVGEIRDRETANIAVEAALTGHLVLATLHTNDAPSTVTRLGEMGVEPFLISSSLIAVVAQRLVRKLCPVCKSPEVYTREEILSKIPDFPVEDGADSYTIYQSKGCISCNNTGYKGRKGVYEILRTSDELRVLILNAAPVGEIQRVAVEQGMKTLRQDGLEKVKDGTTSMEELLRVIV